MSQFEYDDFHEPDFENNWTEQDWNHFLDKNGNEITRFLNIYQTLPANCPKIDETIRHMGWQENDEGLNTAQQNLMDIVEGNPKQETEPFTFHKQPIFIVIRSLHRLVSDKWKQLCEAYPERVPLPIALDFARNVHEGESQAIMGIQAMDMGDLNLAICHFKRTLSAINESLKQMQQIDELADAKALQQQSEVSHLLFEKREVLLLVMKDCREEIKFRNSGRE